MVANDLGNPTPIKLSPSAAGQVVVSDTASTWAVKGPGALGALVSATAGGGADFQSLSAICDVSGKERGSTWWRDATGWGARGAGPNGTFLKSNGPGADLSWEVPAAAFFAAQGANRFLCGPASGAAGVPTWRALVAADIPAGADPSWGATLAIGATSGGVSPTFSDGDNLILGSTTGSKIGTATTQLLGLWGVTPIVQPVGTTDILTGLVNMGARASGANPPLNMGTGALTCGLATPTGIGFGSGTAVSGQITGSAATVTASTALLNLSQTWNSAGVTFDFATWAITDTASAAASRFLNCTKGGTAQFQIDKAGKVSANSCAFGTIGGGGLFSVDVNGNVTGTGGPNMSGMGTITGTGVAATNGVLTLAGGTNVANQIAFPDNTVTLGGGGLGLKQLFASYTNTATVGAVTINKMSGRVNIAATGTSVVVTNSLVTAASHVVAWLSSSDSTGRVLSVVSAAGSFTITVAATTAQASYDFVVFNAD